MVRLTATIRDGLIRPLGPVRLPEGARVRVLVSEAPSSSTPIEERVLLLAELHELMRSNPFLDSARARSTLDW